MAREDTTRPPPRAPFVDGTLVGGQYRVDRVLEFGGMGVTYIAQDQRLRRDVVLKTIHTGILNRAGDRDTYLARFEQEAVLAAQLSHRTIIPIFQFGEHEGVLWYAMEYIADAKPLSDLVDDARESGNGERFLPLDDLRTYFMDAAAGLRAIHELGAVHRDIKAENLLCFRTSEGPGLKILDFGVAHVEDTELTRTGQVPGTPTHMPPESLRAMHAMERVDIDARIDLYALGVTLYRALTADTRPFFGSDRLDLQRNVITKRPRLPSAIRPGMPDGWDTVVMTLMAKRPENRYRSAAEVYEALKNIDTLPPYEPPEHDSLVALPIEVATAPAGLPVPIAPGDLPDLSEHSASGLPPAPGGDPATVSAVTVGDTAPAAGPSLQLQGVAADYQSLKAEPEGRFASLPKRLRLGIVAIVLIALVVVGMLVANSLRSPALVSPQTIISATDATSAPKQITAGELLREQDEAQRERLLDEQRRSHLQALATDDAAGAAAQPTAKPVRRKGRRRKPQGTTLAAAETAMPQAPTAEEPRRKKGAVVTFADEEAGEGGAVSGKGRLGIPTGYKVRAKLDTPISSTAPNTLVTAVFAESVRFPDIGEVVPKGTKAIGRASFRVQGTSARVEVKFNKLVFPDRSERAFNGIAVTSDGQAGLLAGVRRRDDRGKANAAEAALDVVDGALGVTPGGGAAGRYSRDARTDARELRQSEAIVTVPAGTAFKVQFVKSI